MAGRWVYLRGDGVGDNQTFGAFYSSVQPERQGWLNYFWLDSGEDLAKYGIGMVRTALQILRVAADPKVVACVALLIGNLTTRSVSPLHSGRHIGPTMGKRCFLDIFSSQTLFDWLDGG